MVTFAVFPRASSSKLPVMTPLASTALIGRTVSLPFLSVRSTATSLRAIFLARMRLTRILISASTAPSAASGRGSALNSFFPAPFPSPFSAPSAFGFSAFFAFFAAPGGGVKSARSISDEERSALIAGRGPERTNDALPPRSLEPIPASMPSSAKLWAPPLRRAFRR